MSKNGTPKAKQKLTRAEKREIAAVIARAKGDGKPHSAQDSLPFEAMYPDGLCRLADRSYSKCIEFEDINYQLAGADDKTATFENLCDFYNCYDSSIGIQLSLISRYVNKEDFQKTIEIAPQGDDFDGIRAEYTEMLRGQLARGNNGLIKTKFLTLTIEADNHYAARSRLARIEADTLGHFKVMGAAARVLDGKQRLALLHGILHPDGERFSFEWGWLAASGLSVKDFIAPSSFHFVQSRQFLMGNRTGAVSFLQILAPELSDRMLADFMDSDTGILVTLHIRGIDQNEAIRTIKRKITDLDAMKIAEQKKAVRSGYDMDIIPSDLATYGGEAKNLLHELQSRNEKMFLVTFLVMNFAEGRRKLENAVLQASGVAQKYNCSLVRLDFQQEAGFVSSLPLGINQIEIKRGLTTSSTAVFVPFTTQELFQGGEALYYGLNALSNNMILCDRKKLKNPNGLILGTPGSGKSFSAKRSITNEFLVTSDDIIICDPEAEYFPLVQKLKGQVIRISPASRQYVNPMDINLDYSDDDSPLALKSDFLLSFCEIVAGGRNGLEPVEKTLIDRAVRTVYRGYLAAPEPENMPVLEDLYDEIKRQPEPEALRVASALELYVHGSLNVFNHRTNVDIHNRLVCFDIKELGKQLKQLGMLVIQDQVWNRVTINRAAGKAPRYYIDEFHLLLRGEVASWSVEIWKRFRKWGGIPTGITQNIKDFLASPEIENIFENSDFVYMLNQAAGDREILAKQLNISPQQLSYVTHSEAGEGLIFYGNVILPFIDRFPQDTELYRIMTTRPGDLPAETGETPKTNMED
ncbi:VirB4-like conjugal transfer ATPase, CD1110 family [Clostridium transplantifaecale]|uniref:VirB4-like conjugal transfer ATPase, CD1110 family n=1 Tax=Clostridium transplantifaecale TaxID=2479838 RepID=UPI000F633D06